MGRVKWEKGVESKGKEKGQKEEVGSGFKEWDWDR